MSDDAAIRRLARLHNHIRSSNQKQPDSARFRNNGDDMDEGEADSEGQEEEPLDPEQERVEFESAFKKAKQHALERKFELACDTLAAFVAQHYTDVAFLTFLVKSMLYGRGEIAARSFIAQLVEHPSVAFARILLNWKAQAVPTAFDLAKDYLRTHQSDHAAWLLLAKIYRFYGNLAQAQTCAVAALRLSPQCWQAARLVALVFMQASLPARAASFLVLATRVCQEPATNIKQPQLQCDAAIAAILQGQHEHGLNISDTVLESVGSSSTSSGSARHRELLWYRGYAVLLQQQTLDAADRSQDALLEARDCIARTVQVKHKRHYYRKRLLVTLYGVLAQHELCVTTAAEVFALNPVCKPIYFQCAWSQFQLLLAHNKTDLTSVQTVADLLTKMLEHPDLALLYARWYTFTHKPSHTAHWFLVVLQRLRTNEWLWNHDSVVFFFPSIEHKAAAIQLEAYRNLGQSLFDIGQYYSALPFARAALEMQQSDLNLWRLCKKIAFSYYANDVLYMHFLHAFCEEITAREALKSEAIAAWEELLPLADRHDRPALSLRCLQELQRLAFSEERDVVLAEFYTRWTLFELALKLHQQAFARTKSAAAASSIALVLLHIARKTPRRVLDALPDSRRLFFQQTIGSMISQLPAPPVHDFSYSAKDLID
eukprot:TRINITY_DN5181_c0_g1_i3.p1 TRINITY_DN5181_c0_g1~~TRINITY_DN5181_c0_g1_i3.p1  ORF type:complete len:657 (-),score=128.04 TRINITY_DN5181_c0_g1_i3:615-2585(-)